MKLTEIKLFKRDLKDVFGAHMLKDVEFDTEHFDMPYVDIAEDVEVPKKLVPYSKIRKEKPNGGIFIHFYQHDYVFDGYYGLWNAIFYGHQLKKGFSVDKLKDAGGIICPDYSVYGDFPIPLKIWNIYRSRAIGAYFNSIGIPAIPSFHANGPETCPYALGGLRKHTIVAVSTVGCLHSLEDRKMFLSSLEELIRSIEPKLILLYGTESDKVKGLFDKYHQQYVFYPSDISEVYGGVHHGNEG